MNSAVLKCLKASSVSYGELGSKFSACKIISKIESTIDCYTIKLIFGRFSLSPLSSLSSLLLWMISTVKVSPVLSNFSLGWDAFRSEFAWICLMLTTFLGTMVEAWDAALTEACDACAVLVCSGCLWASLF